jgi:predicted nucleic acid-binding protein
MTATAGSPTAAFVDTNVLLSGTAPGRAGHVAAWSLLEAWPTRGIRLYGSGQVIREYLAAATRPKDVNGLGLPIEQALANVTSFLARIRLLDETAAVAQRLRSLARSTGTAGKQVHDANVVATMLEHGVALLVTEDVEHFRRFNAWIQVVEPGGALLPGPSRSPPSPA